LIHQAFFFRKLGASFLGKNSFRKITVDGANSVEGVKIFSLSKSNSFEFLLAHLDF
jgi:hypothetical protein